MNGICEQAGAGSDRHSQLNNECVRDDNAHGGSPAAASLRHMLRSLQ